ncbi:DUF6492 family protein [Paracraurococcus lichenis]|uniref:DUF6492 family protein n=1 Tax=Paracraurococcus lichenis TaxID=3064888 RepID=A0ABT9DXJ1_9PROT|nr:DUF6492 family protein [Paracraurococcus sp. LOR1-02]MDO9708623.1 DUF6492 family protein [Paracraurococcus sp. LOR1-02]
MRCAVFCKSFRDDFDRLTALVESYERFVDPAVTMLVSVPDHDMALARLVLRGHDRVTLVTDESYTGVSARSMGGWVHQQLCKLSVHRTGHADSYFALDSDSYFIRPFGPADFVNADGLPRFVASPVYTVYQAGNDLLFRILEGAEVPTLPPVLAIEDGPRIDLRAARAASAAQQDNSPGARGPLLDLVFGAELRSLAFQPSQFLIAPVLQAMEEELAAQGGSFAEVLSIAPWEYNWFASYCLYSRRFSCAPMMSPTIAFVSSDTVAEARRKGVTHTSLSRHFAAVQMAARHHEETSLDR